MTEPVVIEVIEKGPPGTIRSVDEVGILAPNEIRINGRPVLSPRNEPVIVHQITQNAGEPVKVTLTLYATVVRFAAEEES